MLTFPRCLSSLSAGDIRDKAQLSRVNAFGDYLQKHLIPQYTPSSADFDAIIEVLTVHASPRKEVELTDFHEALRPETTRWHHAGSGGKGTQTKARSTDYWKIFADDESYHEGHGRAYEVSLSFLLLHPIFALGSRLAALFFRPFVFPSFRPSFVLLTSDPHRT